MNNHFIIQKKYVKKISNKIIFTLFLCMNVWIGMASAYVQATRLSIKMDRGTLQQFISMVEKQSDFTFVYTIEEVNLNETISLDFSNESIDNILDFVLSDKGLGYKITDRHIALFKKEEVKQQTSTKISGKVTDVRGEPLIGVNVTVPGTTNGTVTDIDGNFFLEVGNLNLSLQFSYIGYRPLFVELKGRNIINVRLEEDVEQLDEVVVTGYGGTQIRSKLTNSISSVKEENLRVGLFSNPAQALSGAVSGLRVIQSSGNPSAAPTIVLRGGTNLDGTGSPLVIIDGQLRESLNDINPEDIESMEILKDAGATALYGARANNGVVLISTKRGKSGHTSINVKAKLGLNYLNTPYDFMNARDYLYWMRTAYQRSAQIFRSSSGEWVGTTNLSSLSGVQPYGTGNIYWADAGKQIPADGNFDSRAVWSPMIYTPDLAFLLKKGWQTMIDPVFGDEIIYKDWSTRSNIKSPAISQDYNINVSGGNENGSYYSSIGYNRTEGLPLNQYYQRITAIFNADYKIRKWLTSYTNISFANSKKNDLPNGLEDTKKNEDHFFTSVLSTPPTMRGENPTGEPLLGASATGGNLIVNLDKYKRDNNADKITLGQNFKFDITNYLYVKAGAIWMYDETFVERFDHDFRTGSDTWDRSRKSSINYERIHRQTYNAVLNYDMTFKREHTLSALAGIEYYDEYRKGVSAAGSGAPTDEFADLELTMTGDKKREIDSWHERQRILSFFGRVNYDYKGKYLLSATLREDGYSILLGDNRWGAFPGVSVGWIFGKEEFMKRLSSVVSFAKLRASYGLNGNVSNISGEYQRNGAYDLQGSYITVPYGGSTGYLMGKIPNPGLRWEKSSTFEVGLDLSFLENRINANLTFYNRKTQDKYANIPLPGSSGIETFRTNNGEIRNRGLELELGLRIIQTKDWNWNVNVNAAFNKNKILKLPYNGLERNRQNAVQVYDPKTGNLIWVGGYQEGEEPGALYAFQAEGLYKDVSEIPGNLIDKTSGDNGSNGLVLYGPEAWDKLTDAEKIQANGNAAALPIQPGDVRWKDVNKDGIIDDYDMVRMGNKTPRWTGGINSTLKYKDFSLYVRMDYGLGFKIIDSRMPWIMGNMVGFYNTVEQTKETWTPENPNATYPIYTWADQLEKRNYARPSSLFVYNGNYLAFREISFTYSLPQSILSKWNIQNLDFTITGQNLGYLTAAKNVHSPELSSEDGIWAEDGPDRSGGYPLPRTVVFGINLTF